MKPAILLKTLEEAFDSEHVVATWDIGQEKPFKNWLAEYTE